MGLLHFGFETLVPLLRKDADLALLIITFSWQHLRNTDFMSPAFCRRDAGLMSLRRDVNLALLNIASVR